MRFGVIAQAGGPGEWESTVTRQLAAAGCAAATGDAGADAIDFVLDFSARSTRCDTRYGCWSFEIDARGPWAAGAVDDRRPFACSLVARTRDERVVLQHGTFPALPTYARLRTLLQRVLARWPARAVAEIASGGWPALPRIAAASPAATGTAARYRLTGLAAEPWRFLAYAWDQMTRYDIWNVGIVDLPQPIGRIEDLRQRAVRWLPPQPPLCAVADPFPYRHDGVDWLLVEEFGHARGVYGRIARIELRSPDASLETAIDRGRHVSYPCTFAYGDTVYCAPETAGEHDGVPIYRLQSDGTWREWRTILRGLKVVDPTFVHYDGRWWLFCANAEWKGSLTLELYSADAVDGEWMPHPLNPIKSDCTSARPGGRPFTIDRRLFRPAQDCSRTYGGAISVMEIVELSRDRYREIPAARLEPDPSGPYPDGLHHLVVDGRRLYIDGKKERRDPLLWMRIWQHRRRRR